jgi:hypothetical protein
MKSKIGIAACWQSGGLLPSHEDEYRPNRNRGDSGYRRHQASFFRRDFEGSYFHLVTAFGVSDSAHCGDDGAGDDEQQTNPAEWAHDYPVRA